MESDAVEFLEWITYLAVGSSKTGIHRDTLHLTGFPANINAAAFLDIAEIDRVGGTALMGDHRRPHMPNERPLRLSEKGVGFDIGRTRSGAETFRLVFDQQLPDDRLAHAAHC